MIWYIIRALINKLLMHCKYIWCGSLAQLGEHLPYKQEVIGSSPITPTIYFAGVAQR